MISGSGKAQQTLSMWVKDKGEGVEKEESLIFEEKKGDGAEEDSVLRAEQYERGLYCWEKK